MFGLNGAKQETLPPFAAWLGDVAGISIGILSPSANLAVESTAHIRKIASSIFSRGMSVGLNRVGINHGINALITPENAIRRGRKYAGSKVTGNPTTAQTMRQWHHARPVDSLNSWAGQVRLANIRLANIRLANIRLANIRLATLAGKCVAGKFERYYLPATDFLVRLFLPDTFCRISSFYITSCLRIVARITSGFALQRFAPSLRTTSAPYDQPPTRCPCVVQDG